MRSNPTVFLVSAAVILSFVIIGAVFSTPVKEFFVWLQEGIVSGVGWFYIASVAFFLVFVIWLMLSPYGKIKLGKDHETPAFNNTSWFAMLFSAGMGIGLLFYSVAEPIMHWSEPVNASPESIAAAKEAMLFTFFHWGLHAWAIYIVVGLSLAYFSYRHNLPLTIRSTLYPILGSKIYGPIGNLVEIMAVFGTLFGVATSLGLGVMQVNAGLSSLGIISVSTTNQLILIGLITLGATISVVSGLDKGIRLLSQMNLWLGLALILIVLALGPTLFLLSSLVQSIGIYLQNLVQITFKTDAFRGTEWQKSWTMFYWGWWISWAPFVGMFIARISRGRTIRQFIRGILAVPTLLTFTWLVVFGNTALHIELFQGGGIAPAVQESIPTALYVTLDKLPLSAITSLIATLVITTFFVTSSDSGSMVIDILTSNGDPNPPVSTRIFWSIVEGSVAAVLLLTGGLVALQTAALTTALPFCIIMLFICYSLVKGLRAGINVHSEHKEYSVSTE